MNFEASFGNQKVFLCRSECPAVGISADGDLSRPQNSSGHSESYSLQKVILQTKTFGPNKIDSTSIGHKNRTSKHSHLLGFLLSKPLEKNI